MDHGKRIVIVANDEVGVIAGITRILADGGLNLEGIDADVSGDQGTIVLSADDTDRALALLNQAGYRAVGDDTIVLRLPDVPGALAKVADSLKQAGVNIQNLHILARSAGYATVAITADDRDRARAVIGNESII
jgi:hypothetical protein